MNKRYGLLFSAAVAAAGIEITVLRLRRRSQAPLELQSFDPAPQIVLRARRAAFKIEPSPNGRIGLRERRSWLGSSVEAVRDAASGELRVACTRGAMTLLVPRGTAVRLDLERSAGKVVGVDNVALACRRSAVELEAVAGSLGITLERAAVKIVLAPDRQTLSLDIEATRSALRVLLTDRGAVFDVDDSRSAVRRPEAHANGVPVSVHAERSAISFSAA